MVEAGLDEGASSDSETHLVGERYSVARSVWNMVGSSVGENYGDAVAQEFGERMGFDGGVLCGELECESSGADVAGGADFKRDPSVGKEIHQRGIVNGGDAVADAFGAEEFDGFANFIRAADFSACIRR